MDFPIATIVLPEELRSSPELVSLKEMRGHKDDVIEGEGAGGVRFKAMREEALRLGAQSGLAHRYTMIMQHLAKNETDLNVTYSFAGFVRNSRLLVPAIVESQDEFSQDGATGAATEIRKRYTIEEEAKIVSVAPTWRDYLWQSYETPEKPHPSLMPRTDGEVEAWKAALDEGWVAGVSQANQIYQDRQATLNKAVEGRHLYTTLESKNVFSPAALNVVAHKVTFNGRTMNVGEVIYTIKEPANYKQASDWKPVWTRQ